jgi:hypothetical protein
LFDEGTDRESIQRCDECWTDYDDAVADDDVAALPEARWLSAAQGLLESEQNAVFIARGELGGPERS